MNNDTCYFSGKPINQCTCMYCTAAEIKKDLRGLLAESVKTYLVESLRQLSVFANTENYLFQFWENQQN